MTFDEHVDCDSQLNEAEDRIIELLKRIKELEARIKKVCDLINKESEVSKWKILNWLSEP